MITQDINELIFSFNQQAADIKNCLTNILVVVSDGRVPAKGDMDYLDSYMKRLSEKYEEIYQYTKDILMEDEMPPYGGNVVVYADALKNSRARLIKEQIDNTRQVLLKFISIKAMLAEYATALKPYQDAAVKLLEKISASTIDNEIISETDAPKAFLSAMDLDDINGVEGFKLLEQISQHYPIQVQWGLVGKQYYYDQKENERAANIADLINGSEPEEKRMVPVLMSVSEEESNKADSTNNILEESAAVAECTISSVDTKLVEKISTEEVNDFSIENSEHITDESYENVAAETNVLKVINKTKNGTPSASSFRKEVVKYSKINHEVRTVLPLLTNLGILTKEQIYLFGVCMECFEESDKSKDSVDNAVEALISKGYLACFEFKSKGELISAYCLSNYCYSCLHKESIASQMKGFWVLSFGNHKFVYDSEAKRSVVVESVKTNALLLQYVYAMKDSLNKDDYHTLKHSIRWENDHYHVAVINNGEVFNSYLVTSYTDIEKIEDSYLLMCEDYDAHGITFNAKNTKLFIFEQGDIHCYNIENGSLMSSSTSAAEPEEIISNGDNTNEYAVNNFADIATEQLQEEQIETVESIGESPEVILENITPDSLLERKTVPSDDEFCAVILDILNRNVATKEQLTSSIIQSVLLAKGAELENDRPKAKKLSAKLRLATNLLTGEAAYTSENLASAFINPEKDDQPMMLAAYLFAMLAPAMAFDYGLKNQTDLFFAYYEKYFGELSAFKPLFNKMMSVRDASAAGFSPAVIALLGSDEESQAFLSGLRKAASACLTVQAPKTRMKALPVLYNNCFGPSSDLHECMQLIADDKKESYELEFVETILAEYCSIQNDTYLISMDKIADRLNEEWDKINFKNKFKLEYDARDQALRQFHARIEVMRSWAEHINNLNKKKQDISRLRTLKVEILNILNDIQKNNAWKKIKDSNVLSWMLQYMKVYLNGRSSKLKIYSELLFTGVIGLNDDGTPNIDATMAGIRFYEPWRNALRHIVAKKNSVTDIKAEILGDNLESDTLKDNLHQLEMLGRLLDSTDEDYVITEGQLKEAVDSAEERTTRFKEKLELAYTYNQINETEKETLAGIMTKYKGNFYEYKDFACWRRFLEALEEQIQEFAAGRKKELRAKLDSRLKNNEDSTLLKEANRLLEEDMNFAVTEEYINRFDTGEIDLDEGLDMVLHDRDYFGDFLSNDNFDRLLQECRRNNGHALKTFGWNFLEKNLPKEWTSRLRDDSRNMITSYRPGIVSLFSDASGNRTFACITEMYTAVYNLSAICKRWRVYGR